MRSPTTLTAVLTCAAALCAASPAAAADCPGGDVRPAAGNVAQVAASTLCLVNQQRAVAGLPALVEQKQLDSSSTAHSADMVRNSYFAHDTPSGVVLVERLATAGYKLSDDGGWAAGENIAWGSGALATPAAIVDAWMHSAGHRANILNASYREVGLGIVIGAPVAAPSAATYTTDFASGSATRTVALPATKAAKKAPAKSASKRKCVSRAAAASHKRSTRAGKRRATRTVTCGRSKPRSHR